jgi:DNA-binding NarL/FixJ family response regulator
MRGPAIMARYDDRPPTIRVVVVVDHPLLLEAVGTWLTHAGMRVVGTAREGRPVLDLVAEQRPDVLVLDARLPDLDGVEVARRVRAAFPDVAVLIFTGYQQAAEQAAFLRLGVRGYLHKTISPHDLMAAIRIVAQGGTVLGSGEVPTGPRSEIGPLTIRERQVLKLLGDARRNAEIASALRLSEKTVELHIHHLLTKLGARSRTEAVLKAQQLGFLGNYSE